MKHEIKGKENKKNSMNDARERNEKEYVMQQYNCSKYCRCCPFPGLKCVVDEKPAK